ncbi:MAG: DUF1318 domain-containing protein [Candidatus Hydrogenedentes bacterium]|nr:DUF1318 domain-containing protein [Candidatus Hydrogenedentota bacterium]
MTRVKLAALAVIVLFVAGCVIRTEHRIDAHITLDIRHIEEQVGGIFDYVEGRSDTLPGAEEPKAEPTSWLYEAIDAFNPIKVAYAAELNQASPLVKEIAQSMRDRNAEIAALKDKGCLGENNRGYVELRDCDGLADAAAKNAAQKTLSEENKDRKALYNELARLNKEGGATVSTMEAVGAAEKLKNAKSGHSVQLPPAGKYFDEFKASAPGTALGAACKPEAWVTLP